MQDLLKLRNRASLSADVIDAVKALQSALEAAGDPYPFVASDPTLFHYKDGSIDFDAVLGNLTVRYSGYLADEHRRIAEILHSL